MSVNIPKEARITAESGKGILNPPDGLTVREQARWWVKEPEMLLVAMSNGNISPEVMDAIERAAKDNDLAFKVIDSTKVDGLTNEDRSRLFALSTDGGDWMPSKRGRSSKALSNLRMAFKIREVSDEPTRKKMLTEAIYAESNGMIEKDAVRKRIKEIEKLWESISSVNPLFIEAFIEACPEKLAISAEQICELIIGGEAELPALMDAEGIEITLENLIKLMDHGIKGLTPLFFNRK